MRCAISDWILDNVTQVSHWPAKMKSMLLEANSRTARFIGICEQQLEEKIAELKSKLMDLPEMVDAMEHEGATKRKERYRQRVMQIRFLN